MTTKCITGLDDITLIDAPVTISIWTQTGRAERIEHRPTSHLFQPKDRALFRPATLVTSNAYGDPFSKRGRLVRVVVGPRPAGGSSPWQMKSQSSSPENATLSATAATFPRMPCC